MSKVNQDTRPGINYVVNKNNKKDPMYAVATMHDPSYQRLGDITDKNKKDYCERHGYGFHCKTDIKFDKMVGFEKIPVVLNAFKEHPEYEWLLFAEADTMITNFTTKIEDLVNNDYHFIVAVDVNDINAGVFLVRNSEEGRGYLQMILDSKPNYLDNWQAEQAVIQDTCKQYPNVVKIVNQRYFNSFDYKIYHYTDHRDCLWQDGNWQQGDFIIHWPAVDQDNRIKLANHMQQFIVK
jgi:hypothetical protein